MTPLHASACSERVATASPTKEISSVPAKHGCGGGCPPRRNRGVHPQCPCTHKKILRFGSDRDERGAASASAIHRADQQGQYLFAILTPTGEAPPVDRPSIIADGRGVLYGVFRVCTGPTAKISPRETSLAGVSRRPKQLCPCQSCPLRNFFSARGCCLHGISLSQKKNLRPEDHTRYQVAKRRETTE